MTEVSSRPLVDTLSKLDCSKVVDIFTETQINNYKLPTIPKVLLCDTFSCPEISKRVQLVLTTDFVIFYVENFGEKNYLLYTPISNEGVFIRTVYLEREVIGEYNIQLWIHKRKIVNLKADSKALRNKWLGADNNNISDPRFSSWNSLNNIVDIYENSSFVNENIPKLQTAKPMYTNDKFNTYKSQIAELSPMESPVEHLGGKDFDDWYGKTLEVLSILDNTSLSDTSLNTSSLYNKNNENDKTLAPQPTNDLSSYQLPKQQQRVINSTINLASKSPLNSRQSSTELLSLQSTSLLSSSTSKTPSMTGSSSNGSISASSLRQSYSQSMEQKLHVSSLANTEKTKKRSSFVKSVMSVVSKRSSLLPNKTKEKSSSTNNLDETSNRTSKDLSKENSKPELTNHSEVKNSNNRDSLRNIPAVTASEPPALPVHLIAPNPQTSFINRYSVLNNLSTHSFASMNSSDQSTSNNTPPLTRPSSVDSMSAANQSNDRTVTPNNEPSSFSTSSGISNNYNAIRSILYSNDQFQVFHWKDETWYAVEEECILEVRLTYGNRSCVAVYMKYTGQLYLNAWILPDTLICRTNETDLSLSLHITGADSAMHDYLFHCESRTEADKLHSLLEQMHQESIKMNAINTVENNTSGTPPDLTRRSSTFIQNTSLTPEQLAKTLNLAMECKCKLFFQSSSSKWTSLGSVQLKISQQHTTKRMHIGMDSYKNNKITQLVSSMVNSSNVERISAKRISFMLVNEHERNSVVYMIRVAEEAIGDRIIQYIKTINAESGW